MGEGSWVTRYTGGALAVRGHPQDVHSAWVLCSGPHGQCAATDHGRPREAAGGGSTSTPAKGA
eukprot:7865228-Pyramimonas_sp.AAC.1